MKKMLKMGMWNITKTNKLTFHRNKKNNFNDMNNNNNEQHNQSLVRQTRSSSIRNKTQTEKIIIEKKANKEIEDYTCMKDVKAAIDIHDTKTVEQWIHRHVRNTKKTQKRTAAMCQDCDVAGGHPRLLYPFCIDMVRLAIDYGFTDIVLLFTTTYRLVKSTALVSYDDENEKETSQQQQQQQQQQQEQQKEPQQENEEMPLWQYALNTQNIDMVFAVVEKPDPYRHSLTSKSANSYILVCKTVVNMACMMGWFEMVERMTSDYHLIFSPAEILIILENCMEAHKNDHDYDNEDDGDEGKEEEHEHPDHLLIRNFLLARLPQTTDFWITQKMNQLWRAAIRKNFVPLVKSCAKWMDDRPLTNHFERPINRMLDEATKYYPSRFSIIRYLVNVHHIPVQHHHIYHAVEMICKKTILFLHYAYRSVCTDCERLFRSILSRNNFDLMDDETFLNELVGFYVEKLGLDIHYQDDSFLKLAITNGRMRVCHVLLAFGANISSLNEKQYEWLRYRFLLENIQTVHDVVNVLLSHMAQEMNIEPDIAQDYIDLDHTFALCVLHKIVLRQLTVDKSVFHSSSPYGKYVQWASHGTKYI